MTKSIDFYFDIISPYSYIAHKKIEKVTKEKGLVVGRRHLLHLTSNPERPEALIGFDRLKLFRFCR